MDLIEKINLLVSEYIASKKGKFIPGETPIQTGMAVYDDKEINAIINSVLGGWFGLGKLGHKFEKEFSKTVGKKYSTYVNSGSSANFLALCALKNLLNLKGGEIIVAASSFPTTVNPVVQLGFKPHFIDIDRTLNVTPDNVLAAINKNTVGIIVAHTLGNPARIGEIKEIADSRKLFLIEDCCDALGSKYTGRDCGSWGDASTYSFYPAHIITTGEGGMVCTNNQALKRILVSLRDWGRDCFCSTDEASVWGACGKRFDFKVGDVPYDHKYIYSQIGYNFKPLELQAAMGLEQLAKLGTFIEARKRNFELYKSGFSGLFDYFEFPEINNGAEPVFFGLPITIKNPKISRQELTVFLNKNNIATRLLFGGNLIYQPAYKDVEYAKAEDLSNSDNVFKNLFWIGIHPGLGSEAIDFVCSKFREFLNVKH